MKRIRVALTALLVGAFMFATPAQADVVCNTYTFSGHDDSAYPANLPFTLKLGLTEYENVFVTTNGTLTFGRADATFNDYPQTPSVSVAGYDWVTFGEGAYVSFGSTANTLCVEWSLRPYPQSTGELTQIRLVINKYSNGTWHGEVTTFGWLPDDLRRGIRYIQGEPVVTIAGAFDVGDGGVPIEVTPAPTPSSFTEPPVVPSPEPTIEPTPSIEPTLNPEPTPTSEPSQSSSPTPEPTARPTIEPTPEATQTPEPSATPSSTPELTPTPEPSESASVLVVEPMPTPVDEPTPTVEPQPTPEPTPTQLPQEQLPEPIPETTPILEPTIEPLQPPLEPTLEPTPIATDLVPNLEPTPEPEPVQESVQVVALEVPSALASIPGITAVFQAAEAFMNIGSDMTDEEREESQSVVVAAVIVTQLALPRRMK